VFFIVRFHYHRVIVETEMTGTRDQKCQTMQALGMFKKILGLDLVLDPPTQAGCGDLGTEPRSLLGFLLFMG